MLYADFQIENPALFSRAGFLFFAYSAISGVWALSSRRHTIRGLYPGSSGGAFLGAGGSASATPSFSRNSLIFSTRPLRILELPLSGRQTGLYACSLVVLSVIFCPDCSLSFSSVHGARFV
ncbi:MAG TPA: hypothetical protein PLN33_19190 [Hyphomonadaceae bacterium]|jgi:hypothetical protein|nr:hypothetical protein [Hyphomonadaceae bacterium]